MQESLQHERILRNFRKQHGQFQPMTVERGWAKLGPEDIYQLLQAARRGTAACDAKNLLAEMASAPWTIKSTAKEGGYAPNAPLHITLAAPIGKSPAYHLNCREIPGVGLYIYEITHQRLNA